MSFDQLFLPSNIFFAYSPGSCCFDFVVVVIIVVVVAVVALAVACFHSEKNINFKSINVRFASLPARLIFQKQLKAASCDFKVWAATVSFLFDSFFKSSDE